MDLFSKIRDSIAASIAEERRKQEEAKNKIKETSQKVKDVVTKVKDTVVKKVQDFASADIKRNETLARGMKDTFVGTKDNEFLKKSGQTLQKFPELKLPEKTKETVTTNLRKQNMVEFGPLAIGKDLKIKPSASMQTTLAEVMANLPGDIVRSYGKTSERLSTPEGRKVVAETPRRIADTVSKSGVSLKTAGDIFQDPGVQTALDVTDFLPGGLVLGGVMGGVKALTREGGEKVLKEFAEKGAKAIPDDLAKALNKAGAFDTAEDFIRQGLKNLDQSDIKAIEKAKLGLRDLWDVSKKVKGTTPVATEGFSTVGKLIDESRLKDINSTQVGLYDNVYHGSPNNFESFDLKKLGQQGRSEGSGFYFTDSKDLAAGYARGENGVLYKAKLNIKNPIKDINQKTVTKSQIKSLVEDIYSKDKEAFANYGIDSNYIGKDKTISEMVSILTEQDNTDLDLANELINSGILSPQDINRAFMKATGYDGVVTSWDGRPEKLVVAFDPDQIKILEKTNPNITNVVKNTNIPNDLPLVAGQKPANEILIPEGMNERKFVTSVRNKEGALPEIKERIQGFYKELPNPETISQARSLVESNSDEALRVATEQGPASAIQNAVRMELASKYQREGNIESALNMLEDVTAKAATSQGQAVQILSAWGRLTPEGALRYAQRVIKKSAPSAKRIKAENVAKSISDEMIRVNSGVVDQIAEGVRKISDNKGITKRLASATKEKLPLVAEERLAKKVVGNVTPVTKKPIDPKEKAIRDMVDTLYKVAKQSLPEKTKNINDPIKLLAEAVKDRKTYGEVWDAAKGIVKDKLGGSDEAMEAVENYLKQNLDKPFADSQLKKVMGIEMKAENIDLGEIVKRHYSEVNRSGQNLVDRLVTDAGLNKEDAEYLAKFVKEEFEKLTKAKKESILNNLLSEHKINKKEILQKIVELSNLGAFDNTRFLPDVSKKFKIPTLTPELGRKITDLANNVQTLPEGSRERVLATAKLLDTIAEQVPASFGSRVSSLQTLGQLVNPKTAMRNIIGNLGFDVMENIKDLVAYPVDLLTGVATGSRTKSLPSLVEQAKGFKKGLKLGIEDSLQGVDTAMTASKFDLPKKVRIFGTGSEGLGKKVDDGLNTLLSLELKAPDRAFFQSAYEESIRQQVRAKGLTEPTQEMIEEATFDGLYKTFQDDSVVSELFSRVKKALNFNQDFGLGDLVLKYPKTPGNIMARGIDYSPAGFISATYELVRPFKTGEAFRQKRFVEDVSRALTGTFGLMGTGAMLHKMGIITGGSKSEYSGDYDLEQEAKQSGLGAYRLNVSALLRLVGSGFDGEVAKPKNGDLIMNYDWFQPQSIVLAMGADIDANNATAQGVVGSAIAGFAAGANTLAEQPLMSGIETLFGYGDFVQGAANVAAGMPNSMIPTFLNQIKQLSSNATRDTRDPSLLKQSANQVMAKIPFVANKLPQKVNTRGVPMETYQNGTNNIFNVFFNPAFVSKLQLDPIGEEVFDIFEETGETQQAPRLVKKTVDVNGRQVQLNGAQIAEMQRYVGKVTNEMFSKAAADPKFQSLPDDKKAQVWANMTSDIFQAAKIELLGHRPKNPSGKVIGILKANKKREDVNRDVFKDLPLVKQLSE